jgi:two-component system sensor histidine kinase BaeS
VPRVHELGLALTTHPPAAPVEVDADPERLAQVVANLVENASKYATSRIDVAAFGPVVTIDDDGPGIPAGDLPRVFDRLWTDGRGVARQVGSGLGLAIVAELVRAMHGEVHAESPVPGSTTGTRLVLTLRRSG